MRLAFDTWDKINNSRAVDFQLKEETITDINLLNLKLRHPKQITIKAFTKHYEGINGADWEWWFVDKSNRCVGFRIQAKILNINSNEFEHLHYKAKGSTVFQCDKLIQHSLQGKYPKRPLYCLYLQTNDPGRLNSWRCYSTSSIKDLYGCSLLNAFKVRSLRSSSTKSLSSIEKLITPWHCLVCCSGYGGTDYVSRIDSYAEQNFPLDQNTIEELEALLPESFILSELPPYVARILEEGTNDNVQPPDDNLYGIVVYRLDNQ